MLSGDSVLTLIKENDMTKKNNKQITDPMLRDVRYVFAERLKEARIAKGYSQRDLEKVCGISNAAISQYENAIHPPSIVRVRALALMLDVSQGYLLGDKDDSNTNN